MRKTIIIEDEKVAVESLKQTLVQVTDDIEVIGVLQSVEDSVEYFKNSEMPDLVFMDIHLADGSAFAIFDRVKIDCPIVFTTAYDEYALKAFEVNSIDYLLKPISKDDLKRAVDKLDVFSKGKNDYSDLLSIVAKIADSGKHYKSCFLVPERDKLIPLSVKDISYFYIDDKVIKAVSKVNKSYYFSQNLDEIMQQLDPKMFFRANRQYIVAHDAIKDVSIWFGNKISLNLTLPTPENVIVSKARVAEFKSWFSA